jgi:hypothetical protein
VTNQLFLSRQQLQTNAPSVSQSEAHSLKKFLPQGSVYHITRYVVLANGKTPRDQGCLHKGVRTSVARFSLPRCRSDEEKSLGVRLSHCDLGILDTLYYPNEAIWSVGCDEPERQRILEAFDMCISAVHAYSLRLRIELLPRGNSLGLALSPHPQACILFPESEHNIIESHCGETQFIGRIVTWVMSSETCAPYLIVFLTRGAGPRSLVGSRRYCSRPSGKQSPLVSDTVRPCSCSVT